MTSVSLLANAPDLTADDYIVIGLAACFLRDDGEMHPVQVAEPIPSAALEAVLKGIPTSYDVAFGTTIGTIMNDQGYLTSIPDAAEHVQLCDQFMERAIAAARTYKTRPEASQHIPVGTAFRDLNHSTERKRVLNSERIVKTEDNVKQHAYTHQKL
ncbi:MAG: hypothetical protein EA367_01980 [Leptolyngbya sp. DLM2.Bin15]|nr:MAG: hypothetical protein EA367_01980 [Leptolyngbya sp. DLM2.Bin15]